MTWRWTMCRVIGLAVLAVLFGAVPAAAQARDEVSLGYSFLRLVQDDDHLNLPTGWNASFSAGFNEHASLVGDISGNHKSAGGETLSLYTLLAGVRFHSRRSAPVVAFGQALAGIGFAMGGNGDGAGMVQVGGGVDIPIGRSGRGLRVQLDVPVFFNEGESMRGVRFTTGVVLPLR